MKKSRLLIAVLAATLFVLAAFGLVACDKDAGDLGGGTTGGGGGGGGNKTYTITFDADGGTLSGSKTLTTDASGKVTGTTPTATKDGNTFGGWAIAQGTQAAIDFSTKQFLGNQTVYAIWTPVGGTATEYTIEFNYGAGSGTTATAQTVNGKLATLPTPTPPATYTNKGWFTAATGGTEVTTNTVFTQNGTIYAQYTEQGVQPPQPESDGELLVGGQVKLYLTDNTPYIQAPPSGAKATYEYYATGVQLNAGDVVTFRIKGEVLAHHATPAEGPRMFDTASRHGVAWNQAAGAFTVKSNSTGVFSIYVRYYDTDAADSDDNPLNADHPCWSIEFTDGGVDQLVPGGLYLVGDGFANAGWAPSTECYIDPDEGLTVTLKQGDSFKTCHSDSAGTGAVWDMGDNSLYKEVNGNYLDFSTLNSGMGNAGVKSGTHTYKVTYEDGMVVFTCID